MAILAFIPARGGSKGIPGKNLAPLAGRPLIDHTVEAARASAHGLDLFVSSDDQAILDHCRTLGLDVSYVRPARLATDEAPMADALIHALDHLEARRGAAPEHVLLLQPTSPLRTAQDIDGAIDAYLASGADTLASVHEMAEHPYECLVQTGDGWSFLRKPDRAVHRRQDYGERFHFVNGAIYLCRTEVFRRERAFLREGSTALYVMPRERGLDIDTPEQLELARMLLEHRGR